MQNLENKRKINRNRKETDNREKSKCSFLKTKSSFLENIYKIYKPKQD